MTTKQTQSVPQPTPPVASEPPIELPSDKYILSLNKRFATVETNENNELLYTLKNPISLKTGDTISLYKSYLNVKGQNSNTISLDKDYTVTMNHCLYVPNSLQMNAELGKGNEFYDFNNWQEFYQVPDYYQQSWVTAPPVTVTRGPGHNPQYSNIIQGDFNNPMIGVQMIKTGTTFKDFVYSVPGGTDGDDFLQCNFTVPAGQYDVNALALLITQQVNQQTIYGEANANIMFKPGIVNRDYSQIYDDPYKFTKQFDFTNVQSTSNSKPLSALHLANTDENVGNSILFLDHSKVASIIEDIKRYIEGDTTTKSAFEILQVDGHPGLEADTSYLPTLTTLDLHDKIIVPKPIAYQPGGNSGMNIIIAELENNWGRSGIGYAFSTPEYGWGLRYADRIASSPAGPGEDFVGLMFEVANYGWLTGGGGAHNDIRSKITTPQPEANRVYGTRSFNLLFDSENRFTISNLHEPYRIPTQVIGSAEATSNPSSAVANQATKFLVHDKLVSYPMECSSGNMIMSFDFLMVKLTTKWRNLIIKRDTLPVHSAERILCNWALAMLPHDYWFESEAEAKAIWEKESLWFRLGFQYEQMGDISTLQESYVSPNSPNVNTKIPGFITHNSYSTALATSMSGLGGQLSVGDNGSSFIQTFDSVNVLMDNLDDNNIPIITTGYGVTQINDALQYIFVLATSQYYSASELPDLSGGNNYYIIQSDIVPSNYLDESNSQRAVIGFVDREFSTADTIFSTSPIPIQLKQDKILNTVTITILNPDGTRPSDAILSGSSAFIITVERDSNKIMNYLPIEQILESDNTQKK